MRAMLSTRAKRAALWTLLVLCAFGILFGILMPTVGRWIVHRRILPSLSTRLGITLETQDMAWGCRHVTLRGFKAHSEKDDPTAPLLSLPELMVTFRLSSIWRGHVKLDTITLRQPKIHIVRHPDNTYNLGRLVSRREKVAHADLENHGLLSDARVVVEGGEFFFKEFEHHFTLYAKSFDQTLTPDGLSSVRLKHVSCTTPRLPDVLSFGEIRLLIDLKGKGLVRLKQVTLKNGQLQLLPSLMLSAINGELSPENSSRLRIELSGSYGGADAQLWSAHGWIAPLNKEGVLTVRAARFSLDRIASILKRTPIIHPEATTVDGALDLELKDEQLSCRGRLAVSRLNVFHPALARNPVLDLDGEAMIDGTLGLSSDQLRLDKLELRSRDVTIRLSGHAERLWGKMRFEARLELPPVPCQKILESLPPSLFPRLQGFGLQGNFSVDLHAKVDYTDLDHVELGGKVGINRCLVVQAPEDLVADRFLVSFEHDVEPYPGEHQIITLGPENPDFVPYTQISPYMISVVLTTEDGGFFRHRGFIPSQFRAALSRNLKGGGFKLGASTISMQLIKNILLSHEKTISRKLQELFLTWYLEGHLSKERMMELYLNVVELGPNIYGVGQAAREYFNKSAKDLTPLEAAFFASLLPSPKKRYIQYCQGALSDSWDRYVRRLVRRMSEKGYLTPAEFEAMATQKIVFFRDLESLSAQECKQRNDKLLASWAEENKRRLRDAILQAAPQKLDLYLDDRPAAKSH